MLYCCICFTTPMRWLVFTLHICLYIIYMLDIPQIWIYYVLEIIYLHTLKSAPKILKVTAVETRQPSR